MIAAKDAHSPAANNGQTATKVARRSAKLPPRSGQEHRDRSCQGYTESPAKCARTGHIKLVSQGLRPRQVGTELPELVVCELAGVVGEISGNPEHLRRHGDYAQESNAGRHGEWRTLPTR